MGDNPTLVGVPHTRRIWQISLYAAYLSAGGTHFFKRTKLDNLKSTVRDAATLIAAAGNPDPCKVLPTDDKWAPPLQGVFNEHARWESVPNRREGWSPELQLNLIQFTKKESLPEDCLTHVIRDWATLGLYTGFRCSEFAQTDTSRWSIGSHALDDRGHTIAFTLADFTFKKELASVPIAQILDAASARAAYGLVTAGTICWTVQKNGDNGQKIDYQCHRANMDFCPVFMMIRIVRRYARYFGRDCSKPLAVYATASGQLRNVVRTDIDSVLKATVVRRYKLNLASEPDKATLARFTSHSLRVGACNILWAAGESETVIQFRLRWRSNAFTRYFRNLSIISLNQHRAMARALMAPHYFH